MKITKYRTISAIYPHLSLECEVMDGNTKYYPNISVNNKGEKEKLHEDRCCCYLKPMDKLGYGTEGSSIDYDKDMEENLCECTEDIYKQMINFWNSNPVFNNDPAWKDWPEESADKFLIYGKYNTGNDRYFLAKVAENKEEAAKITADYAFRKRITKTIPASEFFADCENLEQQIEKVLDELLVDTGTFEMREGQFRVEITGDWKHEHIHTNCILKEMFGCSLVSENVTEEDGSDYYSAIHTYIFT